MEWNLQSETEEECGILYFS